MLRFSPAIRKPIFFGIAIIIAIIVSVSENRRIETVGLESIDTLRCVFALNESMYSLDGQPEDFNYEILRQFSKEIGKEFTISKIPSDSVWNAVFEDEYDIAVYNLQNEIPEDIEPLIEYSTQTKDEIVWLVKKEKHPLLVSANNWLSHYTHSPEYFRLISRFYRSYRIEPYIENHKQMIYLSPYDEQVKRYSDINDLDWRFVTAVIYQESRFHLMAQSHKDAQGLMQLTSATAGRFGADDLTNPEESIKAGTKYLRYLLGYFEDEKIDDDNRLKFALAAYNAGEGRISELRTLADSLDYNIALWDEVKEAFACLPGFSGTETKIYVDNVVDRYHKYIEVTTYDNEQITAEDENDIEQSEPSQTAE